MNPISTGSIIMEVILTSLQGHVRILNNSLVPYSKSTTVLHTTFTKTSSHAKRYLLIMRPVSLSRSMILPFCCIHLYTIDWWEYCHTLQRKERSKKKMGFKKKTDEINTFKDNKLLLGPLLTSDVLHHQIEGWYQKIWSPQSIVVVHLMRQSKSW